MTSDQFQLERWRVGQDKRFITTELRSGQVQLLFRAIRMLIFETQQAISEAALAKLPHKLLDEKQAEHFAEFDRLRAALTESTKRNLEDSSLSAEQAHMHKLAIDPKFCKQALHAFLRGEIAASNEAAKGKDKEHARDVARQVETRVAAGASLLAVCQEQHQRLKRLMREAAAVI